ncbi:MAG: diguanylate cyclase [Symploca sp. SIO2B6]|nr:diguanylate cyclase [Symploca sp. SIO2B6]
MTGTQGADAIILIVDDNSNNRKILSETLSGQGMRIITACNGEDALEKLSDNAVDLILLDVMMPGLNGFDTCDIIKKNPEICDIPVIFMTALTDVKHKVKGLTMGGVDYVTKPFHPLEVVARVNVHLQLRAINRELQLEAARHQQTAYKLERANHALARLANIDGLTQVANRYCFDEALSGEWLRLSRENKPLGLLICDVDHFKLYNDYYGHQAGDECLRSVARTIHQSVRRPADLVARYGGEEFVVLLPDTSYEGVFCVGEAIRSAIAALSIPHEKSVHYLVVTISIGGCSIIPDYTKPPHSIIEPADKALYQAKHQGRNQCIITRG